MDTVLRLGSINRHLLVRFEENLMEAENYVYKLCKEQGVVCSEVLVCDTSRVWIDRDFMIVSYIPSAVMCDAGLSEEQKLPLYREIGRLAKRMHCITSPIFGRVSEILSGLSFSSWSEYLLSELEDVCERLVRDHGMDWGLEWQGMTCRHCRRETRLTDNAGLFILKREVIKTLL